MRGTTPALEREVPAAGCQAPSDKPHTGLGVGAAPQQCSRQRPPVVVSAIASETSREVTLQKHSRGTELEDPLFHQRPRAEHFMCFSQVVLRAM